MRIPKGLVATILLLACCQVHAGNLIDKITGGKPAPGGTGTGTGGVNPVPGTGTGTGGQTVNPVPETGTGTGGVNPVPGTGAGTGGQTVNPVPGTGSGTPGTGTNPGTGTVPNPTLLATCYMTPGPQMTCVTRDKECDGRNEFCCSGGCEQISGRTDACKCTASPVNGRCYNAKHCADCPSTTCKKKCIHSSAIDGEGTVNKHCECTCPK